jgi:isopentenyl-diphosphate delta-isomerase
MSADEILDLVDRDDRIIGQVRRSETDDVCNVRVINVFLRDSQGRLWIPRRTAKKRAFPRCLDMSVGGYVSSGESYDEAFRREVHEEISLDIDHITWRRLGHLTPYRDNVSAFMWVYEVQTDDTPDYNPDDFAEYSWLHAAELLDRIKRGEETKDDLPKLVQIFYGEELHR